LSCNSKKDRKRRVLLLIYSKKRLKATLQMDQ